MKLKNNNYIVREVIIRTKNKVFKVHIKRLQSKSFMVVIQQKIKFIESFQNLVNLKILE